MPNPEINSDQTDVNLNNANNEPDNPELENTDPMAPDPDGDGDGSQADPSKEKPTDGEPGSDEPEGKKDPDGKDGQPDQDKGDSSKPPEKWEDYKVNEKLFGTEEGNELASGFKQMAHGMNLNQGQLSKLQDWYAEQLAGEQRMLDQARLGAEAKLKTEYGDEYPAMQKGAEEAIRKLGGEEAWAEIQYFGLEALPNLKKAFFEAGKLMSEGREFTGNPNNRKNESSWGDTMYDATD
jgi:hypothetical protein